MDDVPILKPAVGAAAVAVGADMVAMIIMIKWDYFFDGSDILLYFLDCVK